MTRGYPASCIGADRDVPAETAVVAGHRAIIFTEINGGRHIESWYARDASCGPHARRAVRRGTCQFGLLSQGFALAGTCVGLVTTAIGIGPRSLVDLMLHVTMIVLLVAGLRVAAHADTARHA